MDGESIANNFDATQLDQSETWTDPRGNVTAIIAMDDRELKLIFSYLVSPEVAVRFRTMYAMQETHGVRELPRDISIEAMKDMAGAIATQLANDMEAAGCEGMEPSVYCMLWMLERPLVQAMILRMAGGIQGEALGGFEVPDALPENFH